MGDKAEDVFLSFTLTDAEKKKIDVVLQRFEDHFIVKRNVIYERTKFNTRFQNEGETVDDFITAFYPLAEHCNFGPLHDELIRDRIVVGVNDRQLSQKLQLVTALTLEKAITITRNYGAVKTQEEDLRGEDASVNRMGKPKRKEKV